MRTVAAMSGEAAAGFGGSSSDYVYSRYTNPTVAMLQDRLAALEADARPRWRQGVQYRLARLERKLAGAHDTGGPAAAPLLADDLDDA